MLIVVNMTVKERKKEFHLFRVTFYEVKTAPLATRPPRQDPLRMCTHSLPWRILRMRVNTLRFQYRVVKFMCSGK